MKTLVTGGARSGKSSFAEGLYQANDQVTYLATYINDGSDLEMQERIVKHQAQRNKAWQTVEIKETIPSQPEAVLLDCLSIYTSNIMYHYSKDLDYLDEQVQTKIFKHIITEVKKLIEHSSDVVVVTNEVGFATVPNNHFERVYRDILGRVNREVASIMDEVYLVVCGCPMQIKRNNWVICEVLDNK